MGDAAGADEQVEKARKLPLRERLAHAHWKARAEAYASVLAAAPTCADAADPRVADFGPAAPKAAGDSNANALDAALDALAAFLGLADETYASKYAASLCVSLVAKGLGGRPKTAARATDALLLLVELEAGDAVVEALVKGSGAKVPKAATAAVDAALQAVCAFGVGVFDPKPLLKALPTLLENKDKNVREKSKALTVELAGWLGRAVVEKALMEKMRDAQKKDVEDALASAPEGRPRPSRLLRRQMGEPPPEEVEDVAGPADTADAPEAPAAAAPDAYDFVEPVDILPLLSKKEGETPAFWDAVVSSKWSERCAALTKLKELAAAPRLVPGSFNDVCAALKKVITKDSNTACVSEACLAVANLASGLRRDFSHCARILLAPMLDKQKEKQLKVTQAIATALSAMGTHCLALQDISDEINAALAHKVPKVQVLTLAWLVEFVPGSGKAAAAKVHGTVVPTVVKLMDASTPEVRETAMQALVGFCKAAGNLSPLGKYMDGFDDIRRKKLEELASAENLKAGGGARAAPPQLRTSSAAPTRSSAAAPPRSPPTLKPRDTNSTAPVRASTAKAPAKRPGTAPARASSTTRSKAAAPKKEEPEDLSVVPRSAEEIAEAFGEIFGAAALKQLKESDWKQRLEGINAVTAKIEALGEGVGQHAETIVRALAHWPGWSEKNFQIMHGSFKAMACVARQAPSFKKREAALAIPALTDKVADIKLRAQVTETLMAFSEACGPQFVVTQVHKAAGPHKNPKVLAESIVWVAAAAEEFGIGTLNVKTIIEISKGALNGTNPAVKTAAIKLLGTAHKYVGPGLRDYLADVKPAQMATLEAEFAKNPHEEELCAAPKRAVKGAPAPAASAGAGGLPRTDISAQITSKLLGDMASANWKERQAALEAVDQIIVEANRRIEPTVGDLMKELKARLGDSNKNLVMLTLSVLGNVAAAMGEAVEKKQRVVLADMVRCCSDGKKHVREAACKALDAWLKVTSPERFLPAVGEHGSNAKIITSAEGRKDIISWLAQNVPSAPPETDVAPIVALAAVGAADKATEVRSASTTLVSELVKTVGATAVREKAAGLPDAAQAALVPVIEKCAGADDGPIPSAAEPTRSASARPATAGTASKAGAASARESRTGAPSLRMSSRSALPRASSTAGGATKAAADPAAAGPALVMNEGKDARLHRMPRKPLRFEDLVKSSPNAAEEVQAGLGPYVRADIKAELFSSEFKKHMSAIGKLSAALPTQLEETISNLDLLLRWVVLRFTESAPNTQSLIKTLDYMSDLLTALKGASYRLAEQEAVMFLPALFEKCGHNIKDVREKFCKLFRVVYGVYPVSKIVPYAVEGLKSKNSRTRVECLQELGNVIERHGLEVCERGANKGTLNAIVQAVGDSALRTAALNTLATCYTVAGEDIWKMLGKVTDSQRSLLEDKFKRITKEHGAAPGKLGPKLAGARDVSASVSLPGAAAVPARPSYRPAALSASTSALPTPPKPAAAAAAPSVTTPGSAPRPAAPQTPTVDRVPSGLMQATVSASVSVAATPRAASGPSTFAPEAPVAPASTSGRSGRSSSWSTAVDMVRSDDTERCIEGMKMLIHELIAVSSSSASPETLALYAAETEGLVHVLTKKAAAFFEKANEDGMLSSTRPCKYVVNTLLQLFSVLPMASAVSEPSVQDIIGVLLATLMDDRLPMLEEGNPLVKALNVLMLKILENAPRTASFCALLLLLRRPPQLHDDSPTVRGKFDELVVKCLLKLTKALPSSLHQVDVAEVLLAIHGFFMSLGVDEIRLKGQVDYKPLRLVKTLLHELTRLLGPSIMNHVTRIPGPETKPEPIIYAYIKLNLSAVAPAAAPAQPAPVAVAAAPPAAAPSMAPASVVTTPVASGTPTPLKVLKNELAEIFKKIGDKATTTVGITELYRFTQDHPEIDISPHLSRTSEAFQLYIKRGLAKEGNQAAEDRPAPQVASLDSYQERLQRLKQGAAPAAAAADAGAARPAPEGDGRQSLAALRERMRSITASAAAGGSSPAKPAMAVAAAAPPAAPAAPAPTDSASTMASLQERMQRLRAMAATK